ncbi:MAG: hypothetical protein KDA92_22430, partial [Planctomycetales bacterium]|nr:hypothetical protein [Planctomycetales bacterium]
MADTSAFPELPILGAAAADGCGSSGGCADHETADASKVLRLPRWLKRQVPLGGGNLQTAKLLEELRLETVCD